MIHTGYIRNIYDVLSLRIPRLFAGLISISPVIYYDLKLAETMAESYRNTSELITTMQELQEYLALLESYFSAYYRIQALIKETDLSTFSLMQHANVIEKQPAIFKSLEVLRSLSLHKQQRYLLFNHGKALYLHLTLTDHVDVLQNTLHDIAELDMYVALATLMRKQSIDRPFCFVQFVDAAEPRLHAIQSWMPLVKKPANDDILLCSACNKIVLNGPNGSGKSMYLKKIGITICMAQTFGIAPATSCVLTPFSFVRTALDCTGDVEQGYSKFTQQKAMMTSFVDLARLIDKTDKKALFLIDESFSGTVEDEASKRIIEFVKHVNHIDNAIFIVSTHLKEPVYQRPKESCFVDYYLL